MRGFNFPGGFLGMSDFTCGVLLKLVIWISYISSEGVSMPSGAEGVSMPSGAKLSSRSSWILGSSSTSC